MEKGNVIEVKNMSKFFKINRDKAKTLKEKILFRPKSTVQKKRVLNNVSLSIKKGETVALIGTNGSGKSTLLKLMTRIIYPNEGTVETQGKLTSLLELGAGFHPDFTGRENIYFNASIFGLNRAEIDRRINDIIEFSELNEAIDDPIRTYSSGMYMRLAFSVAINVDAEILLIDEILAVGDQHFQDKCFEKLKSLKENDKTIVIVSHALDSIKELCTRAIWLYQGELKLDGDPAYVIEEYLNQSAKDHHEKRKKAIDSGQEKSKGAVFIDSPRDFSDYSQSSLEKFEGWAVSDDPDPRLLLTLDGKPAEIAEYYPREDVYTVYQEEFGGFMDKERLGWRIPYIPGSLVPGMHEFSIQLSAADGRILSERQVHFRIQEES